MAVVQYVLEAKTFVAADIADKLEHLGVPEETRKPGMRRFIPVKMSVECARRICGLLKKEGLVSYDGKVWSYIGESFDRAMADKLEQQRVKAFEYCQEILSLVKEARAGKNTKSIVSESCLRCGLSFWYYFDFAIAAKAELDIIKACDSRTTISGKDALNKISSIKQNMRKYVDDNCRRSERQETASM